MSYNNNNNWNSQRHAEELDFSSGQPQQPADHDNRFGSNVNPQFGKPLGGPFTRHQQQGKEKTYNEFLERRGIPAVSSEDVQILRECGRESLIYRCLPITATLCAGIVFSARTRQWTPRFYHYLGAVFVGYFTGKLSYRSVCEQRLINSKSNSPFVNAIRKRRGVYVEEIDQGNLPTPDMSSFESDWSTADNKQRSGIGEFNNYDSGFSQPQNSFQGGPSFENRNEFGSAPDDTSNLGGDQPSQPFSSYDDLRSRNRSSYKNV